MRYGDTVAVDAIDLQIEAGSDCCLFSPSGCGKTSTLRMIAGHDAASAGNIVFGPRNTTDLPPAKRGTAIMFQNYALFRPLDYVAFSLNMKGVDKARRRARVVEKLDLAAMATRRAPARAAVRRPAAARGADHRAADVLLDEPLSTLDPFL